MKFSTKRMQMLSPHFFASLGTRIKELQAAGYDIIRLDEGSPDLPPAPHIISALASSAARPDHHRYQPHWGTSELRSAWAQMYRREFHTELDADTEILPLIGSKEGIFHLSLACVEAGDIVLVPDPGYITYTRGAQMTGAQTYPFPLLPENNFLPDFNAIPGEIIKKSRLLWLNYPNNPTGATASLAFFNQAVLFAREHDLLLCHDAAYSQVTFRDYQSPSVLQVPGAKDVAVEFNSLSKSHNMAGWRSGVLLGNAAVIRTLHTLKTNADSGQFLPIMDGAVAALTGDQSWVQDRNQIYQERRDLVISTLESLGLNPNVPDASIYIWCPIPADGGSAAFSQAVLDIAHVSLTPGIVFGAKGEGYVRISLTAPTPRVKEAMLRLAGCWEELVQ